MNMIDIKLVRENPEMVKENIKKKFQDQKLVLVDEVIDLDQKVRDLKKNGDALRSKRNSISNEIGQLMRDKKVDEANDKKEEVKNINDFTFDDIKIEGYESYPTIKAPLSVG